MGNNYTLKPVQWEFADIIKYIEIILIITSITGMCLVIPRVGSIAHIEPLDTNSVKESSFHSVMKHLIDCLQPSQHKKVLALAMLDGLNGYFK